MTAALSLGTSYAGRLAQKGNSYHSTEGKMNTDDHEE